jgi:hypothetical protein
MSDIGLGVLFEDSDINSGTGTYNSFLRIPNTGEEKGFNTDTNNQLNNKDGIWTHSLLISSLDTVTFGTTDYYEIRLDLNVSNSTTGPNITLEQLQIFFGAAATTSLAGLTEAYNLLDDNGGPLNLVDHNSGSGSDDYVFYIPTDLITDTSGYLTLYADFTGADGGFEEFRVKSLDVGDGLPIINLVKEASPTTIPEGTATDITYTYTLTNTSPGDDALTLTSFIDDNGTPADTSDDVDLLVDGTFVGGDTDGDGMLDKDETWTFTYVREDTVVNAGSLVNTAGVSAVDEEGNNTSDTDDATVTVTDALPVVGLVKTVSPTQVQAGTATDVTFTYEVTNGGVSTDPLHLTTLIDDNGTVATGDDFDVLLVGTFVGGDTDSDGFVDTGETWVYTFTESVTVGLGETRTNIAVVHATDDEGNDTSAQDDASITSFNLGRTPGFWSNNGSKLWDGNDGTWPKGGDLGIVSVVNPGSDIAYAIHDLDGNGTSENATGSRQYLMIGDWDHDGVADANENVLVISRLDALSLLNSSLKQQQDGRFQVARDVVASWLNHLGGSYVGDSDDPNSPMHYIDEAVAWLIQTTTDQNHVLTVSELSSAKVLQSSSAWGQGFDFDGDSIKGENQTPTPPSHDIGLGTTLDIMAGSVIHSGLDHYNNFGFV